MKSHPVFEKLRIFAPGPTPVPEEVLGLLSRSPLHHRTKEFSVILDRVKKRLQFLFQTAQPTYLLSGSGTGAMECVIVNLFNAQDEVLVINGGKFGERWGKICTAFGLKVQLLNVEWGRAADPDEVGRILKSNSKIKGVLFQASETSTGVYHPVQALAQTIRKNSDAFVIVDAITALGVSPLPMDDWGLDAIISGSQKALMLPPGLAFLALSAKAQQRRKAAGLPRFYFNLNAEDKAALGGETAWTPAVSLICGLDLVLEKIERVGLPTIFSFYDRLAAATRAGAKNLTLELFAKESPSSAVTALLVPASIPDGKKIVSNLRDQFGITIAGGQDQWKGKMFRIGHLGFYDSLDILTILSALEITLKKLGHSCELGQGVGAAAQYFLESETR